MARRDEYRGLRTGFFGRLFYVLTWPFRKPLVLIVILCALYVAPVTQGVEYNKVHIWYKNQILALWAKVTGSSFKFLDENSNAPAGSRGIDKVVETPDYVVGDSVAARRGAFGKAEGDAPKTVDVLAGEEVVSVAASDRGNWVVAEAQSPAAEERKVDRAPMVENSEAVQVPVKPDTPFRKLNLKYLDTPEEVKGAVEVVNVNELVVNGTEMFLYGIYADPNTPQGIRGENFLREMVDGKTVACSIVAYTFQGMATANCSVGHRNINKALVDAGFSKDVALEN